MASPIMDISVILSTWNNAQRLAITLEAMTQCRVLPSMSWELIVVNNNCMDNTDDSVGLFLSKLPLVYLKEPLQGLSRARNRGIKTSKGRLIVFTDDDVCPCEDWLASYWNAFNQNPQGFYFGGPIESEFENPDYDRTLVALASCSIKGFIPSQASGPTSLGKHFMGANWACPAVKIKEFGGFDESFGLNPSSGRVITGEESELIRELNKSGWQGYYVAEAKIKHFVPASKSSLAHITSRWEANGEKQAREIIREKNFQDRPRVPFWIRKQWIICLAKWIFKKVCFQKGYEELKPLCHYSRLIKVLQMELKGTLRSST